MDRKYLVIDDLPESQDLVTTLIEHFDESTFNKVDYIYKSGKELRRERRKNRAINSTPYDLNNSTMAKLISNSYGR